MAKPTAKTQPKFFLRNRGASEPIETWVAVELSRCYQELEAKFSLLAKTHATQESAGSSTDYSVVIASLQSSVEELTDAVRALQNESSAVSEEEFEELKNTVSQLGTALASTNDKVTKLNNIITNAPIEESLSAPVELPAYSSLAFEFAIDFSSFPVKTKFLSSVESEESLSPFLLISTPQVVTGENKVVIRGVNISADPLTLPAFSVLLYALI